MPYLSFSDGPWLTLLVLTPVIGAILIALRLFAVLVSSASAHPLGNFTINHYSRLEISPTELRVRFVLDYAELAAYQERWLAVIRWGQVSQ